jgi:hypothetical protein
MRQHPAQHRQYQPVAFRQPRARRPPAQNRQLMAQNKELEFLRAVATREQQDEREQAADDNVDERHEHRQPPTTGAPTLPPGLPPAPHHASRPSFCTPRGVGDERLRVSLRAFFVSLGNTGWDPDGGMASSICARARCARGRRARPMWSPCGVASARSHCSAYSRGGFVDLVSSGAGLLTLISALAKGDNEASTERAPAHQRRQPAPAA